MAEYNLDRAQRGRLERLRALALQLASDAAPADAAERVDAIRAEVVRSSSQGQR